MYSNIFDTVNFDSINYHDMTTVKGNCLFFEALLYTSLLNGMKPALSLSQAIDCAPMLQMIQADKDSTDFRSFIREGYIRVFLYGNRDGRRKEIISYLKSVLKKCEEKSDSFHFSSLPMLYQERYNTRLNQIFSVMNQCVDDNGTITEKKKLKSVFYVNDSVEEADSEAVYKYLVSVSELQKDIGDNYIPPGPVQSFHKRWMGHCNLFLEKVQDTELVDAMSELKKVYLGDETEEHCSYGKQNRTYLYNLLKRIGCSNALARELRAVIDVAYNETVASSAEDDGESDIIFHPNRMIYTSIYNDFFHRDDLFDKNIVQIKKNDMNSTCVFTWELLREIFIKANAKFTSDENWQEVMQRACDSISTYSFTLAAGHLLKGFLTFVPTSLSQDGLTAGDTILFIAKSAFGIEEMSKSMDSFCKSFGARNMKNLLLKEKDNKPKGGVLSLLRDLYCR